MRKTLISCDMCKIQLDSWVLNKYEIDKQLSTVLSHHETEDERGIEHLCTPCLQNLNTHLALAIQKWKTYNEHKS